MDPIQKAFEFYQQNILNSKKGDIKSYIARNRSKILAACYSNYRLTKKERNKLVKSKEFIEKGKQLLKDDPKFMQIVEASNNLTVQDNDFFYNNIDIVKHLIASGRETITKDQIQREIEHNYLDKVDTTAHAVIDKCIQFYDVADIEELCNIVNSRYTDDVIELLQQYFSEKQQFLKVVDDANRYYVNWRYEPLTIDNFSEYVESLPSESLYSDWTEFIDDFNLNISIMSTFSAMIEATGVEFESDELKLDVDCTVQEICDWYLDYIADSTKINSIFTISYVEQLLSNNPHHADLMKAIFNQRKRELDLQKALLSSIPDDYTLLYPLAREMKRKFILHVGPTNSGKTYDAIQRIIECKGQSIYLAPLRLLAFEQFENLNKCGVMCSLLTGEEEIQIPYSTAQSSTIEMLDVSNEYEVAVIDESQMIDDEFRGGAWTRAILGTRASEIHVCMAPHAKDIVVKLIEACCDDYEIVYHGRLTPLVPDESLFYFPKSVQPGDAIIVFSRKSVHTVASHLQRKGHKCSVIYGALPYDVRHEEARKFADGETSVLVSTDAIGMGLNLPIKRVVFLEDSKFDGHEMRVLKPEEVQQIAGRAGRSGIYEQGSFNMFSQYPKHKSKFMSLYFEEVPQIKEARFAFPESLIGVNEKLSEILKRWNEAPVNPLYTKNSCSQMIKLAEELEHDCDDKSLIYKFIFIPFDAEHERMHDLWKAHFYEYLDKGVTEVQMPTAIESINSSRQLKEAEETYECLDLEYQICRRFGDTKDINQIAEFKSNLSTSIIEFLSKQSLQGRCCRICGKPLPWASKFSVCNNCYQMSY